MPAVRSKRHGGGRDRGDFLVLKRRQRKFRPTFRGFQTARNEVQHLALSRDQAGIGKRGDRSCLALLDKANLARQVIRIVVRIAVDDDDLAIGRPVLKHGDERAVEFGGSTQAGNHNREPRHGRPSLSSPGEE